MSESDRLAVAVGVPSLTLMENAGLAVAGEAMRMVAAGSRIAVLCGPGNNGGDGFVVARLLAESGFDVELASVLPAASLKGDAAIMARRWAGPTRSLGEIRIAEAALVVDALYGAGLSRAIEGEAATAIARVNAASAMVLAVDVPSGLDGSTGAAVGNAVIRADRTVTFFRRKPGHVLLPGRELCGTTILADIGIPAAVLDPIAPKTFANAPLLWLEAFPRPTAAGHKYTRGHAVIVSGGIEMSGAARLCARGAMRAGAGLVTVASPPEALVAHASQLNATLLKAAHTPHDLSDLLSYRRYNAVAIGPGLGRAAGTFDKVLAVLASGASMVLDADAVTVASEASSRLFGAIAAQAGRPVVLTPHEGEFKRLFPDLSGSKLDRARDAARRAGAVVVLKGPDTVIAAPDGRAAINDNAPPTLATAGSGDVLAGFAVALLAQGMPAFEAASAAVWLHGECANRFGPGLIAEDLPEMLPRVLAGLFA
ncbi:MAG: NAD(P)H-hydrate dehydratase [Proteobacteria bacterium]|nr:NAD(P)H-hydrate dehydratase [Pseudomonadota bacterium]